VTTWQYDLLGRVTQETNQLNKTRTFKYDAAGNLTERVDRLGRKIEYVYDNLYRNTAEKWWNGTTLVRTLSFTFDAASQLTAASDPAASFAWEKGAWEKGSGFIVGVSRPAPGSQRALQTKCHSAG
jgi:YD repeat-containing protein